MGESSDEFQGKKETEAALIDFIGLVKEDTDLVNDP